MTMKTRNQIITALLVIVFCVIATSAQASMYSRRQARKTIEQTSYIINQAYEIAYYYSYWQTNKVSRALHYNNYAQDLYFYRNYRASIRYSLLARQYALDVIDQCDDYWEFFYYTYFGWSVRYGYNYNFSYRSGYMDGYYDGYYARYCARHRHDYRKDPYHNLHSSWYNDHTYNEIVNNPNYNRNSSSVALGRGETGRTGNSSNQNSNSSIGRRNYANVETNNYFSQSELSMLSDIPAESTMETEFKRKNPTITFSDERLSENTQAIQRNKSNASTFSARNSNKDAVTRVSVSRPSNVTLQNGQTISGRSEDMKDIQLNIDTEFDPKKSNTVITRTNSQNNSSATRTSTPTRNINDRNSTTNNKNSAVTTTKRENNTQRKVDTNRSTNNNRTTTQPRTVNRNSNSRSSQTEKSNTQTRKASTPSRVTNTNSTKSSSDDNNSNVQRRTR